MCRWCLSQVLTAGQITVLNARTSMTKRLTWIICMPMCEESPTELNRAIVKVAVCTVARVIKVTGVGLFLFYITVFHYAHLSSSSSSS